MSSTLTLSNSDSNSKQDITFDILWCISFMLCKRVDIDNDSVEGLVCNMQSSHRVVYRKQILRKAITIWRNSTPKMKCMFKDFLGSTQFLPDDDYSRAAAYILNYCHGKDLTVKEFDAQIDFWDEIQDIIPEIPYRKKVIRVAMSNLFNHLYRDGLLSVDVSKNIECGETEILEDGTNKQDSDEISISQESKTKSSPNLSETSFQNLSPEDAEFLLQLYQKNDSSMDQLKYYFRDKIQKNPTYLSRIPSLIEFKWIIAYTKNKKQSKLWYKVSHSIKKIRSFLPAQ